MLLSRKPQELIQSIPRGPRPAPQPASPPLDSGSGAGITTTRCSGAPDTPYRHSPPKVPDTACRHAREPADTAYRHAPEAADTACRHARETADTAFRHAREGGRYSLPSCLRDGRHGLPSCPRDGRHSLPPCPRDASVMPAKAGIQGAWRGIRPIDPERLRAPTGRCNPGARRDMLAQLHSGAVA